MSFRGGTVGMKRRRLGSDAKNLTKDEQAVLDLIRTKGDLGIWKGFKGYVRRELNFETDKMVENCFKTLLGKNLIKEVPDVQNKGKKRLMGVEFEPSTELTGGVWYQDGVFDHSMIDNVRKACKKFLTQQKVMTADGILHALKKSAILEFELKVDQLKQILGTLCLDNVVFKVKSNGLGEFISFPINSECYKLRPKEKEMGALASVPCGSCLRINECTPDGIISPSTCVYFDKWLDF